MEDGGATEGLGIDDLPEEVLLLMLSFLPPGCLVRLSLLSQRWHALLNDPTYISTVINFCMKEIIFF